MPYDPKTTRELLAFQHAYDSTPYGEYIEKISEQLRGADEAIRNADSGRLKAEADANRYAAELAAAHQTIRRMSEASVAPAAVAAPVKAKRVRKVKDAAATEGVTA